MTNTTKFKVALLEHNCTMQKLAETIGLSVTSLSYKLNNKREFTSTEIVNITNALNLTKQERDEIFFSEHGN